MRIRFKPTPEQRAALRAQLARLERPAPALQILAPVLPAGFRPIDATCTLQSAHADRFVLRVEVRSSTGQARCYALKAYSDDFGERVWTHALTLAGQCRLTREGPCLPTMYVAPERVLVFPWIDGAFLSDIVDDRKPKLLRRAAQLAADLHRLHLVPEPPTTVDVFVAETRGRCDRLRRRWPETTAIVEPLMAALQDAATALDPAEPAPIHGDMAAGQFLWTDDRLMLLDLDMFGYADPAYDVGHFLAQLERRCLWDRTLPANADQWVACFRDAYLAAMPHVSPRNVSFYQGLTLVRKIYTVCRKQTPDRADLVPQLAARARAALEDSVPSEQPR